MRRVDHRGASVGVAEVLPGVRRAEVDVERGAGAVLDVPVPPLALREEPADEPADVLPVRLLAAAHPRVLGRGLARPLRLAALRHQRAPRHLPVLPHLREPARRGRYADLKVFHDCVVNLLGNRGSSTPPP
ncbi:MAG: hypothetical protein MJZ81_06590 [Bacteroidales bacterium]|nr:hypothetical protein [Bacteroidales bacterium]